MKNDARNHAAFGFPFREFQGFGYSVGGGCAPPARKRGRPARTQDALRDNLSHEPRGWAVAGSPPDGHPGHGQDADRVELKAVVGTTGFVDTPTNYHFAVGGAVRLPLFSIEPEVLYLRESSLHDDYSFQTAITWEFWRGPGVSPYLVAGVGVLHSRFEFPGAQREARAVSSLRLIPAAFTSMKARSSAASGSCGMLPGCVSKTGRLCWRASRARRRCSSGEE